MLVVKKNQQVKFRLIFAADGEIYDPTAEPIPQDVVVSVIRSESLAGAIVTTPISYLYNSATPDTSKYITKDASNEFIFHYTIPENIFPGIYTVVAKTVKDSIDLIIESRFEVKEDQYEPLPTVPLGNRSSVVTYRPSYQDINQSNTSSILLIGHADNIKLNNPIKIKSIQSAVDLLGADATSPLLRGVFDAYNAGARDIFICASAPMSEYVSNFSDRNVAYDYLGSTYATPTSKTFYERYYDRLDTTYSIIKELDFIDVVVPLETSFIRTGSVDFLTQLVNYCRDFHNYTGYVQIGIIGTRSEGISSSDVDLMESNSNIKNKYTTYSTGTNNVSSDKGRYVIPIYGEATFSHTIQQMTYVSSVAAAYAGLFVSSPMSMSLIRKRLPGALSLFGDNLSSTYINKLDTLGINTIFRGNKARRGNPFEVYVTNDYTLANKNSVFSKAPQMRLVSLVASEVKGYGYDSIGKFGYDKVVSSVSALLELLKSSKTIVDYDFKAKPSETTRGVIYLYINMISSLGLKTVNLSLAAGPGA
jgi:hypothetical protein